MDLTKKFNILIIDDEGDVREILEEFVTDSVENAKVFLAKDSAEGLAKMKNMKFDLVVSDINTPRMLGTTLLQESGSLKLELRPSHFLLISGDDFPGDFSSKLGKARFLRKPFEQAEFEKVVKELLFGAPKAKVEDTGKIDASFISPFIETTLRVLALTTQTNASKDKVFIRNPNEPSGDITAVIAMNSQKYLGSMAISFEEKCYLSIVNCMLGESYSAINPENQDAAAEICSQIFGGAKRVLNEAGHTIQPAIPSVIVGKSHLIKHFVQGTCIAVRFKTDAGFFTVEAVMQEKK